MIIKNLIMLIITSISINSIVFINTRNIIILPFSYFMLVVGYSGYNMFFDIGIYNAANKKYKTSYITMLKAISGLITLIGPFILSFLIKEQNINSIRLTFIISAICFIITLLYYYIIIGLDI